MHSDLCEGSKAHGGRHYITEKKDPLKRKARGKGGKARASSIHIVFNLNIRFKYNSLTMRVVTSKGITIRGST
jgi:hypothetical protein